MFLLNKIAGDAQHVVICSAAYQVFPVNNERRRAGYLATLHMCSRATDLHINAEAFHGCKEFVSIDSILGVECRDFLFIDSFPFTWKRVKAVDGVIHFLMGLRDQTQ